MPGQNQSKFNKKRLAALGVLVALVILLLVLIVIWFVPRPQTQQPVGKPVAQGPVIVPVTPPQNTIQPQKPVQPSDGELQVASLARNFAERYGSWSTQSNFQNLRDLYPVVSVRLRTVFEQTITRGQPQQAYRGAIVKALTVTVNTLTTSTADASVIVQQVTTDDQLNDTKLTRTLDLSFVKQGTYWLVDAAAWKE